MTKDLSNAVFELLCANAKAGQSINLARAGLHATFEQARTLVTLMSRRGILSLNNESYDARERAELRLLGCQWIGDRPETPTPDGQPTW
jgi:hypothetical protein